MRPRLLSATTLLGLLVSLGSAQVDPAEVQSALGCFERGEFARVIAILEPLAESPDPRIAAMLGVSHYALGHCEAALPYLGRTYRSGAKPEVAMMFAVCNDLLGRPEEVERILPEMAGSDALKASFSVFRGDTLANRGQAREAIENYRAALQLQPDLPGVPYRLGILLSDSHQYSKALAAFLEELRINPSNPAALYSLGEYYLVWEQNISRARGYFEKAVQVDPDHLPGYLGLIKVYLALDEPDQAARVASAAEERRLSDPLLFHLKARALRRLGRLAEAEEAVRKYQALLQEQEGVNP